jgi:hypothetical protein
MNRMFFDKNLTGRSEKRLSIMVLVRLSALEAGSGEVEEKTYTDSLSVLAACECARSAIGNRGIKSRWLRSRKDLPSEAKLFIARSLTRLVLSLASSSIVDAPPGPFCSGRKAPPGKIP